MPPKLSHLFPKQALFNATHKFSSFFYCGCPCSLLEFTNYYQVPRTRELIKLFFFRKAMCTKDIVLCLYCRVACCLTTQLCLLAYFCYYLFFSVIVQWIDNNVSTFFTWDLYGDRNCWKLAYPSIGSKLASGNRVLTARIIVSKETWNPQPGYYDYMQKARWSAVGTHDSQGKKHMTCC